MTTREMDAAFARAELRSAEREGSRNVEDFCDGCAHTRRLIADDMEAIAKLYFSHGVDAAGEERRRTLMLAARRVRTGEYLEDAATRGATSSTKSRGTK